MALIKNAIAREIAREAIVLDLGDLRRQGEAILRQAGAEADRIIAQARQERVKILAGAEETGRAEGVAKGLEEGRARGREEGLAEALGSHKPQFEKVETAWSAALQSCAVQREDLVQGALRDVLRLASLMAERIVKRQIELNPKTVEDQLASVLAVVARPTALRIRIHPADRPIVEQAMPRLLAAAPAARHAEIVDDESVGRAGCIAEARGDADKGEAGGGEIDASIPTQLDRIVEMLLPGNAGDTAEKPLGGAA